MNKIEKARELKKELEDCLNTEYNIIARKALKLANKYEQAYTELEEKYNSLKKRMIDKVKDGIDKYENTEEYLLLENKYYDFGLQVLTELKQRIEEEL